MIQDILINNIPLFITVVTGGIAWIFDRRKRKAEYDAIVMSNKQVEVDAVKGAQEVYGRLVEDVKRQLEEIRSENATLKDRVKELEEQLERSSLDRQELSRQIESFKEQSEKDKKLITQLKKKVDGYEKELDAFRKERK